jgi:magnesium transporter
MRMFFKNGGGLVTCDKWEPNCWVKIENPTEEDKDFLINELNIPEFFYNDIEDIDERPRIEIEDRWCLIVLRVPIRTVDEDEEVTYSTVPLGLIFKDDIFISLSFHHVEMLSDFVLYTQRKVIDKNNNFELVLRILLSASVWFLKYLKQINQKIKLAEHQLEQSVRNENLQTLLQIEKCLVFFTTSLKGNDILIYRIKNLRDYRDSDTADLIEEVEIESRQAQETTNIYRDILSGLMGTYSSIIANNLNVTMRILTSISIILMIPTLVSSFYGMNVPNALQENKFGFWIILSVSISFSTVGVLIFRKKKWF